MKNLDEFSRHILLYSKDWYQKSDDPINDLKILCGKISWINKDYYSNLDIWKFCSVIFVKFVPPNRQIEYLSRMFQPLGGGYDENTTIQKSIKSMLGFFGTITIKNNPLFPDGLGEINTNYLPARPKTETMKIP